MTDNGSPELVFEFSANGKATGTTVTARIGDDVLGVDRFDVLKDKARGIFVDTLCAKRMGIPRAEVERLLRQEAYKFFERQRSAQATPAEPDPADLLAQMPIQIRAEARAMLEAPDLLKRVIDDIAAIGVAGERELTATIYLVGVSRLLDKPLAAIVQAPSSVGKSYMVAKTAELFPKETIIHATSLTPQSLYYMERGALAHRFIVAGERSRKEDEETAETTRALREMLSSGRLTKLVPEKQGGKIITQTIDQPGPIAYVETTTQTKIFDEDANRCLLLAADERDAQTRAVVSRQAATYAGAVSKSDRIVEKHYAAQRMLYHRPVIVPFAEQIAARFDTSRVEARRAFPHLMQMVQASALLHQHQRQIDSEGRLIADGDDYRVARRLVGGPLARLLGGRISDAALRFFDRFVTWAPETFTTTDAVKRDRKTDRAVRGWLRELADAGALEQMEAGKGSRPATWRRTGVNRRELVTGGSGLPETIM
jgi:DNA primase